MSRRTIGSVAAALAAVLAYGCATQELNTKASVNLPVQVKDLRVEFERVEMSTDNSGRKDPMSASRVAMLEKLEAGVQAQMPEVLRRAGINASYVAYPQSSTATPVEPSAYRLKVSPLLTNQTCVATGGCALSARVGLTLLQGTGGAALWHTELQESSMQVAVISQARYDEFARELARAALKAVAPAK